MRLTCDDCGRLFEIPDAAAEQLAAILSALATIEADEADSSPGGLMFSAARCFDCSRLRAMTRGETRILN